MKRNIFSNTVYIFSIVLAICLATWLMSYSIPRLQSRILTQKANIANLTGNYESGVDLANSAVKKDPTNGYAYYYAGLNKVAAGNPTDALSDLKMAENKMPHLPTLLRVRGQAEYSAGKYADAVQDLERYLRLDPIPVSAPGNLYYLYGQALYKTETYGPAAIALQEAEKYDEFSTRSLQARLLSSLLLNEPKYGQFLFRRYLLRSHNEKIQYNDIFTPTMALLKPEIFLEFASSVRGNIPNNAGAFKAMALAHAKLGHENEARSIINELYKSHPNDPDILLTDADVCALLGDSGGAKLAYNKYLELIPDTPLRKQIELNITELK